MRLRCYSRDARRDQGIERAVESRTEADVADRRDVVVGWGEMFAHVDDGEEMGCC